MKLLILSDLHLVSPVDRNLSHQQKRRHFTEARRCLPALTREIKAAAPDLIISLGDLVDWYSEENRDFALAFLHGLNTPWVMTPGNHDSESPPGEENPAGLAGWARAGVETGNRELDLDHLRGYLLNSHDSGVLPGTEGWLNHHLDPERTNAVFTHVPPDAPEIRQAILDREPQRNLRKYVQSRSADLFPKSLAGKTDFVWSGHLHFTATTRLGRTQVNILPLSIRAHEKAYPDQGMLHFFDTKTLEGSSRRIA